MAAAVRARPFTAARPDSHIAIGQQRRCHQAGRGLAGLAPRAAGEEECLAATSVVHTAQAASSSSSTQFAQQHAAQPLADLAAAAAPAAVPQADTAAAAPLAISPTTALLLGGAVLAGYGIKKVFDTPSRAYDQNVGQEYDAWTEEGVLEYYWGEHIHLGYYTEEASCSCKLILQVVVAAAAEQEVIRGMLVRAGMWGGFWAACVLAFCTPLCPWCLTP